VCLFEATEDLLLLYEELAFLRRHARKVAA
jgi:hypothetical protein